VVDAAAATGLDPRRYADDLAQLRAWRSRLAWEGTHRCGPSDVDDASRRARCVHSYEQMVAALRYFPEAWHEYAAFELSLPDSAAGPSAPAHHDAADAAATAEHQPVGGGGGSVSSSSPHRGAPATARARAEDVYRRALVALPRCTMLHLAYAELLEEGDRDSSSSSSVDDEEEAVAASASGKAKAKAKKGKEGESGSGSGIGGVAGATLELRREAKRIAAARNVLVALVKTLPTSDMAWALFQRFVRRVDGRAAAREVFRLTKKARLAEELGHHVYLSHALLEW
jgi:hypothetical protein